jgi:hypothetical protein
MKRTKQPSKNLPTVKGQSNELTIVEEIRELPENEKLRILKIQTEIETTLFNLKRDVFNMGKLLVEAKQIVPHGRFGQWIDHFFKGDLPYSTAYLYMKIYERFKNRPKIVQYIPSTILLNMTQKTFPDEVIAVIEERAEKFSSEDAKEINNLYKLFKTGTIGCNGFVSLARKQIDIGIDVWKGRTEHRINGNMRLSLEFGAGDLMKRIKDVCEIAHDMDGIYPHNPDSEEHKELMKQIKEAIIGLHSLRKTIISKGQLFQPITTNNGVQYSTQSRLF